MPLRVTEVAEGVRRLDSVNTNWYLLEAGGRLTVLDAGLPGDWPEFSAALTRLGYTPQDLEAVLITHHHLDHAGNAERLRELGARVLAHPADAPFLRGEEDRDNGRMIRFLWRPWYARYMLGYLARGILGTKPIARLDELSDGEVLDVPGSPRVIHAPGHTAGSCALLVEDRSLLFTGDSLVTIDVARGPKGQVGPQVVRGPHTEDADLAVRSLEVLGATKAKTVLPGHGDPWFDGVHSAVELAKRS